MSTKTIKTAIEGWFTLDSDSPRLLGSQCQSCQTYYFPKSISYCRNPHCQSEQFNNVELSNYGTIWSYTNAAYPPPEPYIVEQPYQPYALAAVTLEKEQITILGQLVKGVSVDDVTIGDQVELVLEQLYEDNEHQYMIWKWKPTSMVTNDHNNLNNQASEMSS